MFSIKLKKDYIKELEKRLRNINGTTLQVGVFDTSKHYSGFTYVNLFKYLHNGNESKNLPARPVLTIAFTFNPVSNKIKLALKSYLKDLHVNKNKSHFIKELRKVGEFYKSEIYDYFGDPNVLPDNAPYTQYYKERLGFDPNSPLVLTGELRSKITYKIDDVTY